MPHGTQRRSTTEIPLKTLLSPTLKTGKHLRMRTEPKNPVACGRGSDAALPSESTGWPRGRFFKVTTQRTTGSVIAIPFESRSDTIPAVSSRIPIPQACNGTAIQTSLTPSAWPLVVIQVPVPDSSFISRTSETSEPGTAWIKSNEHPNGEGGQWLARREPEGKRSCLRGNRHRL